MPDITLTFTNDINISAQVGDIAYYCSPTDLGGFDTSTQGDLVNDNITIIGVISAINHTTNVITCSPSFVGGNTVPSVDDFILFSKDNSVNMSSPLGYYAKAKFVNNSKVKGEMFATACEIFGSSK